MKIFATIILFVFSFIQQTPNIIYWNKERKLRLEDFKIISVSNLTIGGLDEGAATMTSIKTDCRTEYNTIIYDIKACFDADSSWVKEYNASSYSKNELESIAKYQKFTLIHEQGHFDITEYCARKIRKYICGLQDFDDEIVSRRINKMLDSLKYYQKKYDDITLHAIDTNAQKKYTLKIEKMLDSLKEYENSAGTVILK